VLEKVDNLAVLGGDASIILPLHFARASIAQVLIEKKNTTLPLP
jgi:hypothetical protein